MKNDLQQIHTKANQVFFPRFLLGSVTLLRVLAFRKLRRNAFFLSGFCVVFWPVTFLPIAQTSYAPAASGNVQLTIRLKRQSLAPFLISQDVHLVPKTGTPTASVSLEDGDIPLEWIRSSSTNVYLFSDFNGNGRVDGFAELFTSRTRLILEDRAAPNGIVALAQYDHPELGGNDDGWISSEDEIWTHLHLWIDENADNICEGSEIVSIQRTQFTKFFTVPVIPDVREPRQRTPFLTMAYRQPGTYSTVHNVGTFPVYPHSQGGDLERYAAR